MTNDLGTKEKVLTTRNTHAKYESCIMYHSKAMANVKGFCRQTDRQGKNYMPQTYQLVIEK